MKDYVIYGDTDSCFFSVMVNIKNENDIPIGEFFDSISDKELIYYDDFNDHYVKKVPDKECLSFNIFTDSVEYKPVKYIMKHKVKKRMFKIKWNDNEVCVTEDHSIVLSRNGKVIDASPKDIKDGDKIIGIKKKIL